MITTVKGNTIDMNGTTEWLLFYRLSQKLNPIEFLRLTDSLIQLPNFLFTVSLLTVLFIDIDLWVKFTIPAGLYFFGQMMINLRFGIGELKLLNYPLMFFSSGNIIFMTGVFITCFFFIGWWTLLIVPIYMLTLVISVVILTTSEKKYYKVQWQKSTGNYEIFKNNAFLVAYRFYADKYHLNIDTTPTDEEIDNEDWLKPYSFMLENWKQFETHFNVKAQGYWRVYLHIDK